jgi:hypothetical protein
MGTRFGVSCRPDNHPARVTTIQASGGGAALFELSKMHSPARYFFVRPMVAQEIAPESGDLFKEDFYMHPFLNAQNFDFRPQVISCHEHR